MATLLQYDPKGRPTPLGGLLDSYFDELRDPNTRLPNGQPLPDLFNFTQEEINLEPQTVQQLVPGWYNGPQGGKK